MKKLSLCYILVLFSTYSFGQETFIEEVEIEEAVQPSQDSDVPFAVIDKVPIFPGCEELDKHQARSCFQQKIKDHISRNLTIIKNESGKTIEGRVLSVFIINEEGIISNIKTRGPSPKLEIELKRIINLLPQMKPGTQRGRPVNVSYSLPVTFKSE